ncbi:hypothetical protein [Lysobacter antibioticus]|uniref:hypothetical protein n=1 Tax=Lysobacter antibioticus TaxID=84531 RepID=UPI0011DF8C15|nr:hypothetical protein [Lysobacter antibioticus]
MNRLLIFFLLCLGGCSMEQAGQCQPGSYDGAWQYSGRAAPSKDDVKKKLLGMNLRSAEEFLGPPYGENASGVVRWLFESERRLITRSCKHPDVVLYRQSLLIVDAELVGGVVVKCSVRVKGALSSQRKEVVEMLRAAAHPLDGAQETCIRNLPAFGEGG